jgi:hypothetical protein
MNINELLRTLTVMGNPKVNFIIYWLKGVLTVRFSIDGFNGTTYDLLNARGEKKGFKTLKAVLSDLKTIDPGLNQYSHIKFYFVE